MTNRVGALFAALLVPVLGLGAGCSLRQYGSSDAATNGDGNPSNDVKDAQELATDRPPDGLDDRPPADSRDAGLDGDAGLPEVPTDADAGSDAPSAALSVDPTSKSFDVVVVGMNAVADFEVSNLGDRQSGTPMGTLTGTDAGEFAVAGGNCNAGLQTGDRCTITVRFNPTSPGIKRATLQVAATPGGVKAISLTGNGVDPDALMISASNPTFDSSLPLTTSPTVTFTVRNTGGSPTTALTTAISSSTEFMIVPGGDGCVGKTLNATATCTIAVVFTPGATPGPKSGTLIVMATTGGTASASLRGTALHPAQLSILPIAFPFPGTEIHTTSATKSFTVKNSGDVSAGTTTGLVASLGGANPADFDIASTTCSGALEASGSCGVDVDFTPGIATGRSATLIISGAPGGPVTADLSGTGLRPPAITGDPTSMDFTRVVIGVQTASRTWTITNNGDISTGALTFANNNEGEIIAANNCTSPLAGGDSCTVSVVVKASAGGTRGGMLTVTGARGGMAGLPVSASAGYQLTVTTSGTGTVTSVPTGVSCGSTCSVILDANTTVTLQARTTNGSGAFFSGWSGGGCSGPFRDCALTLTSSITATATFSPMTNNLVFITSGTYPTNRGSAAAYDSDCNIAATAAGINEAGGGGYVAFTSDAASTAPGRLGVAARGWVRMDGGPFKDAFTSILGDQVFNSIRYNEFGQALGAAAPVMTGAFSDGSISANPTNCLNWTSTTANAVLGGNAEGGPNRWTDSGANGVYLGCATSNHIICMGKTKAAPLTLTPALGRLIWLDSSSYSPPTTPDQVCQAERPAGVSAAVALLAYSNKGPSMVLSPTMNYVRPDGILVGTGAQLAAAAALESGIWQHANGHYQGGGGIAGGALTGGLGGSAAATCGDWTSSTGPSVVSGDYGRTDGSAWWSGTAYPCGNFTPLFFYCVQTMP